MDSFEQFRKYLFYILVFEAFIFVFDYIYSVTKKDLKAEYKYSRNELLGIFFVYPFHIQGKYYLSFYFMLPVYKYISSHFAFIDFPHLSFQYQILLACGVYLLNDFLYYVSHYLAHVIKPFWLGHSAHHFSRKFNFAVTFRIGFIEPINYWIGFFLIAFIGVPAKIFFMFHLLHVYYMGWIHSSFPKIKWLEYLFITPSNHRVHHQRGIKSGKVNFGATFIIWDRLFKTYEEEDEKLHYKYGVTNVDEVHPHPIRESLSLFFDMKKLNRPFDMKPVDVFFCLIIFWSSLMAFQLKPHPLYPWFGVTLIPWMIALLVDFEIYRKNWGRMALGLLYAGYATAACLYFVHEGRFTGFQIGTMLMFTIMLIIYPINLYFEKRQIDPSDDAYGDNEFEWKKAT